MDNLQNKLLQLSPKGYNERDSQIINEWKDRVPLLVAQLDFKNHPITTQLAEETRKQIERIKVVLSTQEDLKEEDRKALFKEKKVHEFYLTLFTKDPSGELEIIEKAIDEELSPE